MEPSDMRHYSFGQANNSAYVVSDIAAVTIP